MLEETLEPVYTVGAMNTKNDDKISKDEVSLFKSTFTNTTDREQEYTFKTERSTRSSATIVVG